MASGMPPTPEPSADFGSNAGAAGEPRVGEQGPLGPQLGLLVAQRLLPSLIEVATEVAAELSRLSAELAFQRERAAGARLGSPPPATDWTRIEAQRANVEQRFADAGAWLAVIAAGLGAEIGNRRLVPRLLDSLEALLERALPGQAYRHEPDFVWPALVGGQGQSFEAPLSILTTLLLAESFSAPGAAPRLLRAHAHGQGLRLEIGLDAALSVESQQRLEAWRARLPQIVPGADVEHLSSEPNDQALTGRWLLLELPAGWLS